jgi:hypothetical protein
MPHTGSVSADSVGNKGQKCEMPCTLDCTDKLALVFGARAGDAFRNDLALFGDKTLELLLVFVVDVVFFCVAKSACAFLARRLIVPVATGASSRIHWSSPYWFVNALGILAISRIAEQRLTCRCGGGLFFRRFCRRRLGCDAGGNGLLIERDRQMPENHLIQLE